MVKLLLAHFHFLEAINDAFEVQFSGFHVYTISQTQIACRAMQLRFELENIDKQCP